jgi:hypothetical protein
MADDATYTADQIATAARELREASGADDQLFTNTQAITMLQNEIHLLRERGFSDERIADLLIGFDIEVTAEEIHHHSPKAW